MIPSTWQDGPEVAARASKSRAKTSRYFLALNRTKKARRFAEILCQHRIAPEDFPLHVKVELARLLGVAPPSRETWRIVERLWHGVEIDRLGRPLPERDASGRFVRSRREAA